MHPETKAFIEREGDLHIIANLAAHFEQLETCDGVSHDYLIIEATRMIKAINALEIVDEDDE